MKSKINPVINIHIAVLLFGLAGLFGKFVEMHAIHITLGRVIFATMSLSLLLVLGKRKFRLNSLKHYFVLIFQGVILAFHWTAFFYSIQISSVAIGLISFSTFPLFSVFFEKLILKDKIRLKDILLSIIILIGVYFIVPDFDISDANTKGVIWGILSGLSFALLQVVNRKYTAIYPPYTIAFYQFLVASLVLLPSIGVFELSVSVKDISLLILLGTVFTAFAHTLFIEGIKFVNVKRAGIITCMEPVYGVIAAIVLLNENPSEQTIIGGLIIVSATIYSSVSN